MDKGILSDMKAISFKFDEEYTPDTIFVKEYSPLCYDETKPLGRTLLVAKIPLYFDETAVKKLFSEVGTIVSVNLIKNRCIEDDNEDEKDVYILGYQYAYIVYKTRDSVLKALTLKTFKTLTDKNFTPIKGLVEQYYNSISNRYPISGETQSSDKPKQDKDSNEKSNVDDDGWTVVTTKSKKLKSDPKPIEKLNYKKKKVNKNFYTFQIKESKMKNLAALMEGYEEAKKKVAKMKQNRLFRPT